MESYLVQWYSLKNYSFQWENFKFAKNHENIKFSTEMPYRLVPLPEKLCIFHCSIEKLQFSEKIAKMNRFSLKSIIFWSNRLPFTLFHWKNTDFIKFLCSNKSPEFNEILEIIRFSWKIYHFEALYTSFSVIIKVSKSNYFENHKIFNFQYI